MSRRVGILVGSLLTVVVLASLLFGRVIDSGTHDDGAGGLPGVPAATRRPDPRPAAPPATVEAVAAGVAVAAAAPASADSLAMTPQTWNRAMAAHVHARQSTDEQLQQAVWQPFRSAWAADGFMQRLALATGVPFAVVHEAPDVYQVVFHYRDEAERRARLQHIESVTGLELQP